ncbi:MULTISPECIES: hypothetical protein [unclassified Kitasatospora]|uniref:baeRF2 domain-containing protein n=1 Tax=unclassified Kitasatospora TaxID=2633591 RepID=UPI0033F991ED
MAPGPPRPRGRRRRPNRRRPAALPERRHRGPPPHGRRTGRRDRAQPARRHVPDRYQHRAEDSWEHNAVKVAEALGTALAEVDAHVLMLVGDVRARQYLTKHLPSRVRRDVSIRPVSGSRSPDGAWPPNVESRPTPRPVAPDARRPPHCCDCSTRGARRRAARSRASTRPCARSPKAACTPS